MKKWLEEKRAEMAKGYTSEMPYYDRMHDIGVYESGFNARDSLTKERDQALVDALEFAIKEADAFTDIGLDVYKAVANKAREALEKYKAGE